MPRPNNVGNIIQTDDPNVDPATGAGKAPPEGDATPNANDTGQADPQAGSIAGEWPPAPAAPPSSVENKGDFVRINRHYVQRSHIGRIEEKGDGSLVLVTGMGEVTVAAGDAEKFWKVMGGENGSDGANGSIGSTNSDGSDGSVGVGG